MYNATPNDSPLVSVVIPVIKNDPFIKECLNYLDESTYPNTEVIVVDEGKERSAQRNVGIKKARGKYILILDADMMVSQSMIWDCVIQCEGDPKVVGVYLPERIVTKGWFGRLRDWERQFYTGTLVDVVRFVRKINCPDFDETMNGPEDSDWERRIYGKRAICNFPFYHHDKVGLIKYLKKKAYYARSMKKYHDKNPTDKLLTFKYRCWDVFVEQGKWRRLIAHPIKTLGLTLLIFARGIIYAFALRS
jgi:glycosyltransferase involved in cell wall biosynthesis